MNRPTAFELFIVFLNKKEIKYGVLGNTDHYPGEIDSDVDFVVCRSVLKNISSYIKEFCTLNDLIFIQEIQHESHAFSTCLAYFDTDHGQYSFLQLDFCSDYKSRGRFYLSSETLLANLEFKNAGQGFWKLNDAYEFLYYLIKKIDKGSIDKAQFEHLFRCWLNCKTQIATVLDRFFYPPALNIINYAFDKNDYAYFVTNINVIRSLLFKKVKLKLKDTLLNFKKIFNRLSKPTGLVVGVLGRDGTGKTTLINGIEKIFSICYRDIITYHFYPGFFLNHNRGDKDYTDPHGTREHNSLTSNFKLLFFLGEYLLGYWIKIFPKKVRHHLIIFDRYFIDILVDPVRYRQKQNKWLTKIIHGLIPKPDVWFILDASTKSVFLRKQEVSYKTSEELRVGYLNLHKELMHSYIINAELPPKEVLLEASNVMVNFMHKKV